MVTADHRASDTRGLEPVGSGFPPAMLSWILPLTLAVMAVACYAVTLRGGFVFDDVQNILENRWLTDFRYLGEIFSSHAAGFDRGFTTSYYRPLMHVFYMLTLHLAGPVPWAFHLTNVLLHCAVTVLAYWLVSALWRRLEEPSEAWIPTAAGAFAAALFAVHPVHTEAVAWLAGITDLSFSAFFLAAFLAYLKAETGGWGYSAGGAVLFLLAALCKEPALSLLPALVVYEVARSHARRRAFQKAAVYWKLGGYALAAVAYLVLRVWALGGFAPGNRVVRMDVASTVLTAADLFLRYLAKLVWPFPLQALYSFQPVSSVFSLPALIGLSGVTAIAWGVWRWRHRPVLLVGASLFILPLLPVLYVPSVGEGVFAERYLYLPALGAFMMLAVPVGWAVGRGAVSRVAVAVALLGALAGLAGAAVVRNAAWHDSVSLWSDTVARNPGSGTAHAYLCWALSSSGRYEEAITSCNRALQFDAHRTDARESLASALAQTGRLDEAARQYEIVLNQEPASAEALTGLGLVYMAQGRADQAFAAYREALRVRPDCAEAHNDLGVALVGQGRLAEGLAHLEDAVRLRPLQGEYRANLQAARALRHAP